MKVSKKSIKSKCSAVPDIQFQDQNLTSYSGSVFFQLLFSNLELKRRVSRCFNHLSSTGSYSFGLVTLLLIVHLLLGHRKLQDIRFYHKDPMILRLLGVNQLPNCSTLCRQLAEMDAESVIKYRALCRDLVLDRLEKEKLARITLDFDGTVLSTSRFAEGVAVGYNKKKKGQRSYYPLVATIAQTGQFFDVWHRPGNVHDSNGAKQFILACIHSIKERLPRCIIEVRMDSAFFNDDIVDAIAQAGIEFTISVPFARYTELKSLIENRHRWKQLNASISYFESQWKPKCWGKRYRFLLVRSSVKVQKQGPIQLDLFEPIDYQYEFKVIVTNKKIHAKKVLNFHNGRGYQENLFAELKSQTHADYVPTKRLVGNQIYLLSTFFAHNLNRELQMSTSCPERQTTEKRAPLWIFEKMESIRRKFIQQAGRLTKPQGKLTLTMNLNASVNQEFTHIMAALAG